MLAAFRQSARGLARSRSFAVMAVTCIALGIAVTTTVFTAVDAVLLRPLPYADAERIVVIFAANPSRDIQGSNISLSDYESWGAAPSFSELALFNWESEGFLGEHGSERIAGADATPGVLRVLGVQPLHGRLFDESDERPGSAPVVLLGHGLWQRLYGGDPGLVGRTIRLSGRPHTVIGIMPPGFSFPYQGEFWRPFVREEWHAPRGNRILAGAIGRLAPDAAFETMEAELRSIAERLEREFPDSNTGWVAEPLPLRDELLGDLRPATLLFLGAVALVLLIACANVANLLLARGVSREQELAVRMALGATRSRLVRQLLAESLLLAAVGGALGALLGSWGVDLLSRAVPDTAPSFMRLELNATVIVFAAIVTLVAGVAFGLVPALQASRGSADDALRSTTRSTAGRSTARLRNGLIVAEIALSVLLLTGGALMVRSLLALGAIDPGFDDDGVATMRVSLPRTQYTDEASRLQFYERLFGQLRSLPGVTQVGAAQGIPFSGWNVGTSVAIEGVPPAPPGQEPGSHVQSITPEFLSVLRVPLLRGRQLEPTDDGGAPRVAVVNETFARRYLSDGQALGRRIRFGGMDGQPWLTIVGIVADYRHYELREPMRPAVYLPLAQDPTGQLDIVVRTSGDAAAMVGEVRRAIAALDPEATVGRQGTLAQAVAREFAIARMQRNLITLFAALSLMLAVVGLYGVISYGVAQRHREIGIRVALGASRSAILRLVLAEGARLTLLGLLIGSAGAAASAPALASLFWGVRPLDAISFTIVPAVVAVTALAAAFLPARRAAAVQPGVMLRE